MPRERLTGLMTRAVKKILKSSSSLLFDDSDKISGNNNNVKYHNILNCFLLIVNVFKFNVENNNKFLNS